MNKKTNPGLKIICLNRKASFNYFFEDLWEAGMVLKGSELNQLEMARIISLILMQLKKMVN